jgi:hypothetical protein
VNPLVVFGFVVLGVALLAALTAPIVWTGVIIADHEPGDRFPTARLAAAVAGFIVALTATI